MSVSLELHDFAARARIPEANAVLWRAARQNRCLIVHRQTVYRVFTVRNGFRIRKKIQNYLFYLFSRKKIIIKLFRTFYVKSIGI